MSEKINFKVLSLALVVIVSFLLRVINLNYNSPLNDEAIYIAVGKMGLFKGDWSTFAADSWMAGSQYIYPVLTASAYFLGGIFGSRLLNVIFGVLSVVVTYFLALNLSSLFKMRGGALAAFIASLVVSFSTVPLFVSRLATYDMPSYFFLTLGLFFLSEAELKRNKLKQSKFYFLASFLFFLSFLTKIIIGFYLPLIFMITFLVAKKNGQPRLRLWRTYFFLPLVIFFFFYFVFNFGNSFNYLKAQSQRENIHFLLLFKETIKHLRFILPFWFIGFFGFLADKKIRQWFLLNSGAFLIVFIHLASHRMATLDKHLYLTVLFFALTSGLGISFLMTKRSLRKKLGILLTIIILISGFFSYKESQKYHVFWPNTNGLMVFLTSKAKSTDKILAEEGPQAILATLDVVDPGNIATFDWFQYQGKSGLEAYRQGVRDGYFDYIQLNSGTRPKTAVYGGVYDAVWEEIDQHYWLVFKQGEHCVYQKI